MMIVR